MKIRIELRLDYIPNQFTADLLDLPGSPPTGVGSSPEEAVASLFGSIIHPDERYQWLNCINLESLEIIRKGF
jgi:hypothetical protein